jgi:hypothetical protein
MQQDALGTCPACHQPVLPEYYFCPNCGKELHPPPLPTTPAAQAKVYLHSVILPFIVFITVSKWQGYRYFKSDDQEAKQIGAIAISLLVLSTLAVCYLAYVWTENTIQSSVNSINTDLGM